MLLRSIRLANLLSFQDTTLELRALNVLIGANASGKSNLIAAIGLLKAAPENLEAEIARGGGVRQWISKRAPVGSLASLDARIDVGGPNMPLLYSWAFGEADLGLSVARESLTAYDPEIVFFGRIAGDAGINRFSTSPAVLTKIEIANGTSVFAAYRDPADQTPITQTGRLLGSIEIFREFNTGPNSGGEIGGNRW